MLGRPTVAPADSDIPGTPMDPESPTQIVNTFEMESSTDKSSPTKKIVVQKARRSSVAKLIDKVLGVEEAPAGILQATTSKDAGPDFGAACNREFGSAHCELDGMAHLSGWQQADNFHCGWIVTCQIATSLGRFWIRRKRDYSRRMCAVFIGLGCHELDPCSLSDWPLVATVNGYAT